MLTFCLAHSGYSVNFKPFYSRIAFLSYRIGMHSEIRFCTYNLPIPVKEKRRFNI